MKYLIVGLFLFACSAFWFAYSCSKGTAESLLVGSFAFLIGFGVIFVQAAVSAAWFAWNWAWPYL